jgi:hypothetical protein
MKNVVIMANQPQELIGKPLSLRELNEHAIQLRALSTQRSKHQIDVRRFMEDKIINRRIGGRVVRLEIDEKPNVHELASVSLESEDEKKLIVTERVWEDAGKGIDYANEVLAHELCHLTLHNVNIHSYSSGSALKSVREEERLEWQAVNFSCLFLISPHSVRAAKDADMLMLLCNVPAPTAVRRIQIFDRIEAGRYTGEFCPYCSNITLRHNRIGISCDTCGFAKFN